MNARVDAAHPKKDLFMTSFDMSNLLKLAAKRRLPGASQTTLEAVADDTSEMSLALARRGHCPDLIAAYLRVDEPRTTAAGGEARSSCCSWERLRASMGHRHFRVRAGQGLGLF
jgi:hypothetical protein